MNMTPTCSAGTPKRVLGSFLVLLALFAWSLALQGAYLWSVPVTVVQPDGEVLHLLATGDEYYNWVHDKDNYTIVRDPNTGVVEYARVENGKLAPSGYRVGTVKPSTVGLQPGANVFPDRQQVSLMRSRSELEPPNPAPTSGTIDNLVVFIRFAGEPEFTDAVSLYDAQFNTSVSSMDHYFQEASYGALAISTTFYPLRPGPTAVSYQDSHPRTYYQPYDETTNPDGYTGDLVWGSMGMDREHALLVNAVSAISASVPGSLNLDGDGDGGVDNVCFVVRGGPTGWNTLLWPHQWQLSQAVYINSKQVHTYNFQLQTALDVGVLCHEMFHSLGAPDLYHYSDDGLSPVGRWDLMGSDQTPPQHMSAYMKYKYGHWIASIPEVTPDTETYTLNPLTSSAGQCYKIASSNSPTEFFVIEYRRKTGTFESSIPGSGLLVYRINTSVEGSTGEPPDPVDGVYVYRPGGTLYVNGTVNSANYSSNVGRTAIDDSTSPSSFLSDSSPGGIRIWDIGTAGSTISFKASGSIFRDLGLATAVRAAIEKPTGSIIDSDLAELTELYAGYRWISDLTGLEHCANLQSLDLSGNQISDVTPLAEMTALTSLRLTNNVISDLASLSGLSALRTLWLNMNQISDLVPLSGLTALETLWLFENHISDLAPLVRLTQLTDLSLEGNQISDLASLAELTALEVLILSYNPISDLTPLVGLTSLRELYLWCCDISDISPLVHNSQFYCHTIQLMANYLCLDPLSGEDLPDVNALLARGMDVECPLQTCRPDGLAAAFNVTDEGSVRSDSGFYGSSFRTGAADVAEWVPVTGSVEAGDVLELDPSFAQSYRKAQTPCSDLIAGVVSAQPGVTLGAGAGEPQQALLALSGIVPVKVTNEGGPIQPGDLLVTSSTPGYAMRWAGDGPCPCSLVGKALEGLANERGVISVLLTAH